MKKIITHEKQVTILLYDDKKSDYLPKAQALLLRNKKRIMLIIV